MKFLDYIFEMPYYQDKSLEKIEDQMLQLTRHILKVWLMPKSRDYQHWLNEIRNYLDIMDSAANTKTKRGRISYNALAQEFENIITQQRIKNAFSFINSAYKKDYKYNINYFNSIKAFYDFLWHKLSEFEFSTDDIIEYIEYQKI